MMALATPSRLLALLAGVFALALAVLLLLPSRLPNARSIKAPEAIWALPASVRVDSDLALSAINQRRIWGATGVPGLPAAAGSIEEPPLTPPDWRLAGVFTEAGGYAVLLAVDGQFLPQTLHVGDQFPGGAKILAISNDRISLSLNGRRVSLSTYPQ
jgi:hypothetical protein